MKYVLAGILATLLMTTATLEANAVVCARGVYRAGCAGPNGAAAVGPNGAAVVGPNGAAVVGRPAYGRPAYAHPYANPYYRCYWRAGVRICP